MKANSRFAIKSWGEKPYSEGPEPLGTGSSIRSH